MVFSEKLRKQIVTKLYTIAIKRYFIKQLGLAEYIKKMKIKTTKERFFNELKQDEIFIKKVKKLQWRARYEDRSI